MFSLGVQNNKLQLAVLTYLKRNPPPSTIDRIILVTVLPFHLDPDTPIDDGYFVQSQQSLSHH